MDDTPPTTTESAPADGTVTVADPDEYTQTRRLRAIHDARENVVQTRNQVEEAEIFQDFDPDAGRRLVRRAVENYALEVEPLVRDADSRTDRDYWSGVELGTMAIHPPGWFADVLADPGVYTVNGSGIPEPVGFTFNGLESLFDAGRPPAAAFEMTVQKKHEGVQTVTDTVPREIPLDVLENAYRTLNRVLRDLGIDASLDDNQDAEFDYSDLLEEGPPNASGDDASADLAADGGGDD